MVDTMDNIDNLSFELDTHTPLSLLGSCPAYVQSPLDWVTSDKKNFWVKDETARMGLGSFKALGGVYGVAQLLSNIHNIDLSNITLPIEQAKDTTFVCASAGNHGLAVASGAKLFGARSRIYLSHNVPEDFAARLRHKNAEVVRVDGDYEFSVAEAIADAERTGAVHLADGSWHGYTEPPRLVMEGYTAMTVECANEFSKKGEWPTHVFLQAGVGGLAASVTYVIRKLWDIQPEIIIVEPTEAPCLKASIEAGKMISVEGAVSNMGRLDCKTPSLLAYEILSSLADRFVLVSDTQADQAVEYASKLGYSTTPSGVAGLAALLAESSDCPAPFVILSECGIS